ncbi:cuticle protein 7-like [Penaeus vannamei]|uniref:cuticle protein 7-like n=1 Tax=Penaeus vannamei TaxID=6689 RepID=UPI00387F8451
MTSQHGWLLLDTRIKERVHIVSVSLPVVSSQIHSDNMAFKACIALQVFALAALVVVAIARPDSPPTYGYSAPTPSYAPAKYDFNYAVNDPASGNDFGHQEARDGDHTQGSYYVLLPDGRLQKVTYNVNGDSGYVADVTYEGEAQYPTPKASYGPPQPSYKPPTPSYA